MEVLILIANRKGLKVFLILSRKQKIADMILSASMYPKLPRRLKKWVKKEMNKEGLNTDGVGRIILCSEYLKRAKHCRIAWLNNYYKSIVDAEKVKKSFEEQYQELANKFDKNGRR